MKYSRVTRVAKKPFASGGGRGLHVYAYDIRVSINVMEKVYLSYEFKWLPQLNIFGAMYNLSGLVAVNSLWHFLINSSEHVITQ